MINPNNIKQDDLPLIVLSDHSSGFIQWIIKWRTKANYNHVMTMIWPGEFASQGNVFSSVPLSRYMTKQSRLKFWRIKDLTKEEELLIRKRIFDRLNLPRRKRRYDYLGILGQATGLKFIRSPSGRPYCSRQVKWDDLDGIIDMVEKYPSPKDLNEYFKQHPRLEVYGRWSAD